MILIYVILSNCIIFYLEDIDELSIYHKTLTWQFKNPGVSCTFRIFQTNGTQNSIKICSARSMKYKARNIQQTFCKQLTYQSPIKLAMHGSLCGTLHLRCFPKGRSIQQTLPFTIFKSQIPNPCTIEPFSTMHSGQQSSLQKLLERMLR